MLLQEQFRSSSSRRRKLWSHLIDYDNDGDQDLFIAKCRGGVSTAKFNIELHRNNGNGTLPMFP
jgi:hypothetical protein